MTILLHFDLGSKHHTFQKIQWILISDDVISDSGEVMYDTPSYLYDFIIFLLAVGRAKTLVGYDLRVKLKVLGQVMRRTGLFEISLQRPEKMTHCDLLGISLKPETIEDLHQSYQLYRQTSNVAV